MAKASAVSVEQLDKSLRDKVEVMTGFGTPEEQSAKLAALFKKFDTNNSGALDVDEFTAALKKLNFLDCNVEALFNKYDVHHNGTLEYKTFADWFFGVTDPPPAADPKAATIIAQFRQKIADRGGLNGIRSLGRLFQIMDEEGGGRLTPEDMMTGCQDFGLAVTQNQVKQLIDLFDRDRDGKVDFNEFLVGMRPTMSNRRRDLVLMAFDEIDLDKTGVCTLSDLAQIYDVSQHPDVKDGRMTPQQALEEFMSQFGDKEDGISRDEFLEYYKDVSASVDDDDYFELMIRNAWHLAGGEGAEENTANLRVLCTFADGSQRVVGLDHDLGIKKGDGWKAEVIKRLKAQGVTGVTDVKVSM